MFDSLTHKFTDIVYHLPSKVNLSVDFPVNMSKLNKGFCTNGTCKLFCPCHEDIEGERQMVWHSLFLTSVQDGGEWSTSHSSHCTHGERTPGTRGIGGWIGLRASIDSLEKRK